MMTAGVTAYPVWDTDLDPSEMMRTLPLDSTFHGNLKDDFISKG
jgi:hypothetical protein